MNQQLLDLQLKEWQGCYDDSWKDLITSEAFSHPAKFSRGLIQRIYQYCLEKNYFSEGQLIIDPFGGIGLGAIATHYGLNWLGNELEPRFCRMAWSWDCPGLLQEDYDGYKGQCESPQDWYALDLGICSECVYKAIDGEQPQPGLFEQVGYFTNPHRYHGNLERFKKFSQNGCWAKLTQGDSRKLGEVWSDVGGGLVSSPPFIDQNAVNDPKYQKNRTNSGGPLYGDYGQSQGQLANMPEGLVSSPPYAEHGAQNMGNQQRGGGKRLNEPGDSYKTDTDGQLGSMPEGLVSSPPFAGNSGGKGKASREGIDSALFDRHSGGMVGGMHGTEGNLEGMPHSPTIRLASPSNRGIMPSKESNLCHNVKIAIQKSVEEASDVNHAHTSMLASSLKEEKNQKDLEKKSQGQDTTDQCQTTGESNITSGAEAMIDGGDMPGESSEGHPLIVMGTNVQDADQQNISKSITKKEKKKPTESGITNSTILKPSVQNVTSNTIDQDSMMPSVLSAEKPMEQESRVQSVAPISAEKNQGVEHGQKEIKRNEKPLSVSDAEKSLQRQDDTNIALRNVQKQLEQEKLESIEENPNTFWEAAKTIVLQCHALLAPNSIAVFVTKNYIKKGKEVDFTGNWIRLCESCGFELIEQKRAMLVKNLGTQLSYSGEDQEITVERKSFFRRLAEKNGAPPIDYETVTIMRRIYGHKHNLSW